jgi:hypothetical protein
VVTRWRTPMHPGIPAFMLTIGRLVQNRPLSRCSLVRSAACAPGFLRRRSDPPLIISCKNSKNSEGPFPEDQWRKIYASCSAFCGGDETEVAGVVGTTSLILSGPSFNSARRSLPEGPRVERPSRLASWLLHSTSKSPAAPIPPPTHIVTTTHRTWRRLPSISACPTMRAPDIP